MRGIFPHDPSDWMPTSVLRFPRVSFRAVFRGAVACAIVVAGLVTDASGQGVRVGVRAGPTFGFLNDSAVPFVSAGDAAANTNVRLDLHAGGYTIVPLGGAYSLQTELLYTRKGGHFSRFGDTDYRVERYRLAYLEGQVLGRRALSLPGPLRLHVVAGLTVERFLDGSVRRAVHTEARVLRETIDLAAYDLVQHWGVGGIVGLGLGYPLGAAAQISLDLRYSAGFRSVFTDSARPSGKHLGPFPDPPPLTRIPPALRHDVVTASLSFTIPLRR